MTTSEYLEKFMCIFIFDKSCSYRNHCSSTYLSIICDYSREGGSIEKRRKKKRREGEGVGKRRGAEKGGEEWIQETS